MYCTYLRKRHKRGEIVFYCFLNKEYINPHILCQNCLKRKYEANKPINRISKKRVFVKNDIYNKVLERDKGHCRLCGTSQALQLHHIIYRSEDKSLINNIDNCIMLCVNCHQKVHANKKIWQPKLKRMIKGEENGTENDYLF